MAEQGGISGERPSAAHPSPVKSPTDLPGEPRTWLYAAPLLLCVSLSLSSCSPDKENSAPADTQADSQLVLTATQCPLPEIRNHGIADDCIPGSQDIPPCAWAFSHDAVVLGRVAELRFAEAPVAAGRNGVLFSPPAGACSTGSLEPLLEIELDVVYGIGVFEKSLTVLIPYKYWKSWSPVPHLSEAGELEWQVDIYSSDLASNGLYVGQTLGFALTTLPDVAPAMSPLIDPPFTLITAENGELVLSIPGNPYCGSKPYALDGLTVDEFFAVLEACPQPNAEGALRFDDWGFYELTMEEHSAWCFVGPGPDSSRRCASQVDCGSDEVCAVGTCMIPCDAGGLCASGVECIVDLNVCGPAGL